MWWTHPPHPNNRVLPLTHQPINLHLPIPCPKCTIVILLAFYRPLYGASPLPLPLLRSPFIQPSILSWSFQPYALPLSVSPECSCWGFLYSVLWGNPLLRWAGWNDIFIRLRCRFSPWCQICVGVDDDLFAIVCKDVDHQVLSPGLFNFPFLSKLPTLIEESVLLGTDVFWHEDICAS